MVNSKPEKKTYRLVSATIPSAVYAACFCANYHQDESLADVLLLHSDFYEGTGDKLKQYESVMLSLAKSHKWASVSFCNGISQWLEYVGRKPKATSRWERINRDISDTRHIYRFIDELLSSLSKNRYSSAADDTQINEVWVDMPSIMARYLFAKYKNALKVLYPHAESVFYSLQPPPPWQIEFREDDTIGGLDGFKRAVRRRVQSMVHPALVPVSAEFHFDKAYTFRGETYLADQAFDLDESLTSQRLQEFFSFLPVEAQDYFNRIGSDGEGKRRLSILFMMIPRREEDFEPEVAALIHLLRKTVEVRGTDPVVVKPHPRSTEDYLHSVIRELRPYFPTTDFVLLDQWGAVPGEVAASNWNISCCMGLYTSTLGVFARRFKVPGFTPFKLLWAMYEDDPAWKACLVNYLNADADWLIQV